MKKAFTLVELIIVISVMMILTGLVSLNLVSFSNSTNIDSTKTLVLNALFEAQNNSMVDFQDKPWGVHFESTKVVIFVDSGSGYNASDAQNITKPLDGKTKVTWSLQSGGNEILFQKRTGSVEASGTIRITQAAATKTIEVNPEGMINYQ